MLIRRLRQRRPPQSVKEYLARQAQRDRVALAGTKVSQGSRGGRVSKEYKGQAGLLDRRAATAVMAGMELTAAMALMVWMVLTVVLALLVHAVLRVTQDRSVPWVRRGPTASGARRGSKVHRVCRDRAALMDSIWRKSQSTNGHR